MTKEKYLNHADNLGLSNYEGSLDLKNNHPTQVASSLKHKQASDNSQNIASKPFWFSVAFAGYMDMYSEIETVANYLNAHEGWFCRCAQPMKVEPLNENAYILNVGSFASLGYEVEPKIAVTLDLPQDNFYVMRTVPVPNYEAPGYEVQYKSVMELTEIAGEKVIEQCFGKNLFGKKPVIPSLITRVSWQLSLTVTVEFPKFLAKFPTSLIQKTGDRLLAQIVRQISPRLTYKVQQDFHTSRGLLVPPKRGRGLSEIDPQCSCGTFPNPDDESAKSNYHSSRDDNYAA